MKKVVLGRLLITTGASRKLAMADVIEALERHRNADFGMLCLDDAMLNIEALESGEGRIMSVYRDSKGTKFWVISEQTMEFPEGWVTTVLLPSDY